MENLNYKEGYTGGVDKNRIRLYSDYMNMIVDISSSTTTTPELIVGSVRSAILRGDQKNTQPLPQGEDAPPVAAGFFTGSNGPSATISK